MPGMRTALILSLLVAATATARAEPPRPTAKDHPIIGRWTITLPDGSCTETYTFRADGTTIVTSAGEIAESVFEISAKPGPSGFFKWMDRVTKDNGKKDCSGEITEVGHSAVNYVQFHRSNNMFIMCAKESLDSCIGPFVRVQGQAI